MKKRLVGAVIVLTVLAIGLYFGGCVFAIICACSSALGLKELIDIKYKRRSINFIKIMSYIVLLLSVFNNTFYTINDSSILIFSLLVFIIPIIFYNNKDKYSIIDAFYFIGINILISMAFSNIINMRNDDIYKCIYIFVIAFITDTYAYIGGMLIGKTHFTDISPKKTIEGSVIGTIMGTFIGSMYYICFIENFSTYKIIILSFVLTILSEIGDLTFSSIKRYFGRKDYSNIIPGHGGILDRFDSVIFVSLGMMLLFSIF